MRETLQPGDYILDRAGHVAVHHPDADGTSYRCPFPYEYFLEVLKEEVSPSEYAKTLLHFMRIQLAYDHDQELPEGAIIVPNPEQAPVLTPLERLNLKVLPLFTNGPR